MTLSVVIPVHNGEKYIEQTLTSLINQSESINEIIVVNDASADQTWSILLDYSLQYPQIKPYNFHKNKGVSYARNFGVEKATGEWCLFWDADDVADYTLVEKYNNIISNKLYIDMIFCSTEQIDEEGVVISKPTTFPKASPQEFLGYLFIRNPIVSASGVAIRKSVFVGLGGFDQSLRYSEDWELWLRVASRHNIYYFNETLIQIRRHSLNVSGLLHNMQSGEREVLKRYDLVVIKEAIFRRRLSMERNQIDFAAVAFRLDYWEQGFEELRRVSNDSDSLYFYKGLYFLKKNDITEAVELFREVVKINPYHHAAMNNLACCLWILGERNQAILKLQKLLLKLPTYLDATYNFQMLSENIDRTKDRKSVV